MEKKNWFSGSNKIKIIVISMIIFATSIIGITYAYFGLDVIGNETASSVRLRTAKKNLVYTDVQIASGADTFPGWTVTKTLTVTNNGRSTVAYNIIWRELVNSISNNELVLTAICSSSSGSCSNITETPVAYAPETLTDKPIKTNISIAAGEIHTYQLTVTFKDTGSNQDYNQRKSITGTINIDDFEPSFTRVGTDSTTGLPVVRSKDVTTEEFYDITNAINYSSLISTTGNLYNYASGKSILLSKYSLYVGRNCTAAGSCTLISTSDSAYGLQSASATGYTTAYPSFAVVPFSGAKGSGGITYWNPNHTFNTKYGVYADSANNVYDNAYLAAPDYSISFGNNFENENYSIAYYVEEYINRLGIDGIGRLLTYPEANAMTQTQRTNGSQYWLGSVSDLYPQATDILKRVYYDGGIGNMNHNTSVYNVVRPVIVINTYDIESGS